jgi:hypothetical protein
MVMIHKCFGIVAALTLLSTIAHAGSAPRELYGKSIIVAWSESREQRTETEKETRNYGAAIRVDLYVSTAGRPFLRTTSRIMGGYDTRRNPGANVPSETGPGVSSGATERVDFEGRSILAYSQFPSGARRVAIELNGAAASCKASVMQGKEGAKNQVRETGRGKAEVFSIQVNSVSCSIREGNVFGQ